MQDAVDWSVKLDTQLLFILESSGYVAIVADAKNIDYNIVCAFFKF